MRIQIISIAIMFSFTAGNVALANEISCDGVYIQDDLDVPAMKGDVLAKCGQPESTDGQIWIYNMHNGVKKVLQFNDSDQLESIKDRVSD